jgi:hypothetical protein
VAGESIAGDHRQRATGRAEVSSAQSQRSGSPSTQLASSVGRSQAHIVSAGRQSFLARLRSPRRLAACLKEGLDRLSRSWY